MTTRLFVPLFAVIAMLLAGCTGGPREVATQNDILQEVQARKQIRVGVLPDTPPFSFQIGSVWAGFDIEIAQGIANHLGIDDVVFVPVTTDQRSDKVIDGTVDMIVASMTITRYRERRVDFSIPYFQDGQGIMVAAASPIKNYLDLDGKTVGAVKGSTSSYYMKQINPDANVKTYPDRPALRAAIESGEIDAITGDYIALVGMIANAKDRAAWRMAGERLTVEPYGVAVAPNQSAWRNAINHALIALWEKHDWHASAETWFGPGSKYTSPVNFVMPVYPK